MKKIRYLFLLFLPVLGVAQSRYGVEGVPVCWRTLSGVDSSLTRYVLVSTTGKPVTTVVFENVNGTVVNVSGGSLRYGYCDCIEVGQTFYDPRVLTDVPFAPDTEFSNFSALRTTNRVFFVGQRLSTRGFFSEGDGGGAKYVVFPALQSGTVLDTCYQIPLPGGKYARMDLSSEDLTKIDSRKFGVFPSQSRSWNTVHIKKAFKLYEWINSVQGVIAYGGTSFPIYDETEFTTTNWVWPYKERRKFTLYLSGAFSWDHTLTFYGLEIEGISGNFGTQFQFGKAAYVGAPVGETAFKMTQSATLKNVIVDGNTSSWGGIMLGDTVKQHGQGYYDLRLEGVGVQSYNDGVGIRVNSAFWWWIKDFASNCTTSASYTNAKAIDIVADRRSGDGGGRGSFGIIDNGIISGRGIKIRAANTSSTDLPVGANPLDAISNIDITNLHSESITEANIIMDGTGLQIGISDVSIDRPMVSDNLYQGPWLKAIGNVQNVSVINSLWIPGVEGLIKNYHIGNSLNEIYEYSSPKQFLVSSDLKTPRVHQDNVMNIYGKVDAKWSGAGKNMSPFVTYGTSAFTGDVALAQTDEVIDSREVSPYVITANQVGLDMKTSAARIVKPVGSAPSDINLCTQYSFAYPDKATIFFGAWIKATQDTVVAFSNSGTLKLGMAETVATLTSATCGTGSCDVVLARDAQLKSPGMGWTFVVGYAKISNPTSDPGLLTFNFSSQNSDKIDATIFRPFITVITEDLNEWEIRYAMQAIAAQTVGVPQGVLDFQGLDAYWDSDNYIKPIVGTNKFDISSINFNPGVSGIVATNVEDAIKEVKAGTNILASNNTFTGTNIFAPSGVTLSSPKPFSISSSVNTRWWGFDRSTNNWLVAISTSSDYQGISYYNNNISDITSRFFSRFSGNHIAMETVWGNVGVAGYLVNRTSTGDLQMYTNQLTRMVVTGGGDVGIANTSPQAKLHVTGDAIITSTLWHDLAKTVGTFTGTGTPEGAVSASIGSVFHRIDGGAGTSFYVKEAGTGNTGWVAK